MTNIILFLIITSISAMTVRIGNDTVDMDASTIMVGITNYTLNGPLCIDGAITNGCIFLSPIAYKSANYVLQYIDMGVAAIIFWDGNDYMPRSCGLNYGQREDIPLLVVTHINHKLLTEHWNDSYIEHAEYVALSSCNFVGGDVIRPVIICLSIMEIAYIIYIGYTKEVFIYRRDSYQIQLCATITIIMIIITKTYYTAIDPMWSDTWMNSTLTTVVVYIMHANLLSMNLIYVMYMLQTIIDYKKGVPDSLSSAAIRLLRIIIIVYICVLIAFIGSAIIFQLANLVAQWQMFMFILIDVVIFVLCIILTFKVNISYMDMIEKLENRKPKLRTIITMITTMILGELAFSYVFIRTVLYPSILRDVIVIWLLVTICEIMGIISITIEATIIKSRRSTGTSGTK